MEIKLSDHFDFRRLIRFVIPSIVMMIFTSVYGVVDGLFVSNYAGKNDFAAVNLIMPFPMIIGTAGFMIGTGGTAIVAKLLGQGKNEKANEVFSMLVKALCLIGITTSILGIIFIRPIARLMGADDLLIENCVTYGRILLVFDVCLMLQSMFQSFLVAAEKPKLGLAVTVAAGITNMLLDWIFVGVLDLGVTGAAFATGISQAVGSGIPFVYFLRKNDSLLRLVRSKIDLRIVSQTCINGSSELMTNVSLSLVNILYNRQLLRFVGVDGVAAYGVIMYVNFIFVSIFIGYSIGSSPLIGYNYGADNRIELKNLFKKSLYVISVSGAVMFMAAQLSAGLLADIFVGYDESLYKITYNGFRLFSLAFIVMGFNIFGSAFFTALGNGLISALVSLLRTLVFQVTAVLILPAFWGLNGIWLSELTAEIAALFVTVYFLINKKKRYHYL